MMNATASIHNAPAGTFPGYSANPLIRRRYYPDNGIEVPAVTEFQMREIERLALEETGPDPLYRVERAGLALALLALEMPGISSHRARILVLAGRGIAGETGTCAARHLADQRVHVALCLSHPPFAGQPLSYQHSQYESRHARGIEMWNLRAERFDLIVDCLMDHHSRSIPTGNTAGLIRWANGNGTPVLSYDIPSGIHPTTGIPAGEFIRAAATMAAGLPKTGLTPELCGDLYLADVGLRAETLHRSGIPYISPFENRLWAPLTCATDEQRLDW